MAIKFGSNKKVVGRLRRSQLVTTFGTGATVDMVDYSIIIAGTDYWDKKSPRLHEPNLSRVLRVKYFRAPLVSENQNNIIKPDVPAYRFPYWHFCPKCGRLQPFWNFSGNEKSLYCSAGHAKVKIVPSRFMAACINGHLEDFPYDWWVHRGNFSNCKGGNLRIEFSDETGGLERIIIKCATCGKTRTMAGCMHSDALKNYRCRGKRPWLSMEDPDKCEARLRTVQRGASNVYFPVNASALTIPPWSSKPYQTIINDFDKIENFLDNPSKLKQAIELHFEELLAAYRYSSNDLAAEVLKFHRNLMAPYSMRNLLEDEYKVFCTGNYNEPDDFQFRIERAEAPDFLRNFVDEIVAAKRLREVLSLRGFRRLIPEEPEEADQRFFGYRLPDGGAPLSKEKLDWLPAVEMLGEGIFIKLNEARLAEWERENYSRYERMKQRLASTSFSVENFSARYVLIHTLAHLLIRQLSLECGYSSAALKERLYSTYPQGAGMAGLLIYTSSSDSDGSLGGLVRNAQAQFLGKIFMDMLTEASWCASDPICIQSEAQGYNSLNYAACHACTLLPETSCIMRNFLLDRAAVVGTLQDKTCGFFSGLI